MDGGAWQDGRRGWQGDGKIVKGHKCQAGERSQGQWGAMEGSKLGSGLLKVAAMERPQLEAGRLVDCPKGPVRGQRPHLGLEQWA